jgi:hypothetical protein
MKIAMEVNHLLITINYSLSVEISEMQKIQMQKIEELVLYVIQLNKENEALKRG